MKSNRENTLQAPKKKYASFITDTILSEIIEAANGTVNRKKNSLLPETITRFWIIFGNERDLNEFMKRLYDNFCLQIISNEQNSEQANIIQDLFYADASFSLIYGKAKLDNRNINEDPTEQERRTLIAAINYTWNIISSEILEKFREYFDHDFVHDNQFSDYYLDHSRNIGQKITDWNQKILLPYLNSKRKELKNDSIANIGYCVHNLMETLCKKRNIDNNDIYNRIDSNLESTLEKSDKYLLDCAENLEKCQRTYFDNLKQCELEKSIADSFSKSIDYEFEDDFFGAKSFEEAIEEAIKACRKQ